MLQDVLATGSGVLVGFVLGLIGGGVLGGAVGRALSERFAGEKQILARIFAAIVAVVGLYVVWRGVAHLA
jgi:hypothetical protein